MPNCCVVAWRHSPWPGKRGSPHIANRLSRRLTKAVLNFHLFAPRHRWRRKTASLRTSPFPSFSPTPPRPPKGGSPPDEPIPLFFSDHAEDPEPLDIGKAWNRAVISSRNLKASILVVTAATSVSRFFRWEIQSHSLRAPWHRWLAYRRLSLATVSRRQQFNQPPALRLCSRPHETRRRATKLF